ncbi:metallophosphoesterase family protein [Streptomyces sp. NBC_01477]|uniref:metallophosphoesterase family protein n=1 Tax=Streptomyces sp. NBC_01477 TaxID=2976015 RepID=UPI002E2F5FB0|nr:metallophosphoesterase [Streptomyces sp. NBC_01477]
MRILHISDLHVRSTWESDQRKIIEAFLRDIKVQHQQAPIDSVIFSGDIAFSATKDQYRFALNILLAPLQEELGLERNQIVLSPGNHDIDISRIDRFTEEGLKQLLTTRESVNGLLDDPKSLANQIDRLNPWLEFHAEYYRESEVERISPLLAIHRLKSGDSSVAVASLTSSWRATGAGDDGDRAALIVGDRQITDAARAVMGADIRVAVMHHPLDWLADFDRVDVNRELNNHFHVLCTGHVHLSEPQKITGASGTIVHSSAGSLYQSREYTNSYSILEIDPSKDARPYEATVRTYYDRRDEFDAALDIASDGRVHIPAGIIRQEPHTRDAEAGTPTKNSDLAAEYLLDIVRSESVLISPDVNVRGMADLLVPPALLPLPLEQYIAAGDPEDGNRIGKDDLREKFSEQGHFVIVGDESSGLTSTLRWLAYEAYALDSQFVPAVIDYAQIENGPNGVAAAIKKELAQGGVAFGRKDELPRLALSVDNIDPSTEKKFLKLLKFVTEERGNIYFLGCSSSDDAKLLTGLQGRGNQVCRRYLGIFGRREVRHLVELLHSEESERVVTSVLNILQREKLPRNPSMMAALVSIFGDNETWASGINDTAVIEIYAGMLLGREDTTEDRRFQLDFRERQDILSSFAEKIVREGVSSLSRVETERFLLDYFDELGWSEPSSRVVDSFAARRVLFERSGRVRFRQPMLQYFFAAQKMNDSSEFKEWILRDPISHIEIIRHAAALQRNDALLLQRIADEFRTMRSGLGSEGEDPFSVITNREGWDPSTDFDGFLPDPNTVSPENALGEDEELNRDLARRMDDVLDQLDAIREVEQTRSADRNRVRSHAEAYFDGLSLLSSVLRNSELVRDIRLKRSTLELALNGFGVLAAIIASEQATGGYAKTILESAIKDIELPELEKEELVDRILLYAPIIVAWGGMSHSLASKKLAGLTQSALRDSDFLAEPGQALMAVILLHQTGEREWLNHAEEVFKRHGGRQVVLSTVRFMALSAFFSSQSGPQEVDRLAAFIAEIAIHNTDFPNEASRLGSRNRYREELKKRRLRINRIGGPRKDPLELL